MPENSPAKRWFDKAKDDLVAAGKLQGILKTSSSIVASYAQQAAENYLKGFLIHYEVEPPRTQVSRSVQTTPRKRFEQRNKCKPGSAEPSRKFKRCDVVAPRHLQQAHGRDPV